MFPRLRGQETFVAETFFASEKQKMFLTFSETFCFFNKCFPVCAAGKQCFRNSVSATMFPRLRGAFILRQQKSARPVLSSDQLEQVRNKFLVRNDPLPSSEMEPVFFEVENTRMSNALMVG